MSVVFGRQGKSLSAGLIAEIMAQQFGMQTHVFERPAMLERRFVLRRIKPNRYRPHQGNGERERRRRQIARGVLTASNGLFRAP